MEDTEYLEYLDEIVSRLHEAAGRRALGGQDADRPMQRILMDLLGRPACCDQEEIDRLKIANDLVNGVYGHGLMVDAVLELEDDLIGVRKLGARQVHNLLSTARTRLCEEGLYSRSAEKTELMLFGVTIGNLAATKAAWSDATVLDLLRGGYGEENATRAIKAVTNGVNLGFGVNGSFAYLCIVMGRIQLLEDVALLGMPDEVDEDRAALRTSCATTATGRWLDVLSNVNLDLTGPIKSLNSFPWLVGQAGETEDGPALVDMLFRHDPDHKHIAKIEGTAAHNLLMGHLMQRQIARATAGMNRQIDSLVAAEPTPSAAPVRRNRAL
ncbi:hypothetical protein ABIC83_002797 [Roseateles asaccharophilus]|uniref:hypothetical protein n=1 Tax=Roseateles asaccharophilus TaxID=582607 RepID=UPI003839C481